MAGVGPAKVRVLRLDRNNSEESGVDFRLRCCLTWEAGSPSDYHGDQPADGEIKPFGKPIGRGKLMGFLAIPIPLRRLKFRVLVVPVSGLSSVSATCFQNKRQFKFVPPDGGSRG